MMDGFGMPGGFGFGFGGLFMILWWVIIIVGILALVRWMSKSSGSDRSASSTSKSAMDILKERYARGEIDAQEYQKIKRELME
ncbi:MAG: SHOCT domain-containing protein [Gammaproteobacteria bacterium]|nr:SHOCT domain-containing protein [Gammaproteobacteria bacterium]MBU0787736.1 SHOCT domain-containing protein [Gammaproteobacteria bacterium]MBU0814794.1 SHOCT domain-containing protein [Gammaproteobacteria bacterium]MBU1786098.1 SHOCT domain-containing protein [Gammaproteobacteria bacterium]